MLHDVAIAILLRDIYQDEQEEPRLTTPKFDVLTTRPPATPSHCELNIISSDIKHFLPGDKEIDDSKSFWICEYKIIYYLINNNYKMEIANDNEFDREVPRIISVTSLGVW